MLKHELRAFLEGHNIPLWQWGKGEAKTFDHLFSEITTGETILVEENGMLVRSAEGSALNVYYDDGQVTWLLKEERQVFSDGRTRMRDPGASIGEKMRPGEDALKAAYRALSEEIGVHEKIPLILVRSFLKETLSSSSFPGLYSRYRVNLFEVFLPEHLYKPEGYVEHQSDKSSYFVWEKHSNSKARA